MLSKEEASEEVKKVFKNYTELISIVAQLRSLLGTTILKDIRHDFRLIQMFTVCDIDPELKEIYNQISKNRVRANVSLKSIKRSVYKLDLENNEKQIKRLKKAESEYHDNLAEIVRINNNSELLLNLNDIKLNRNIVLSLIEIIGSLCEKLILELQRYKEEIEVYGLYDLLKDEED